jgi:hypothetical protein
MTIQIQLAQIINGVFSQVVETAMQDLTHLQEEHHAYSLSIDTII